jgi:hypothetical protein
MTPSFRFPLRAGGTNPCAVPLAKRGEPYGGGNTLTPSCRFPLKTGGTNPCAVPLAKRGNLKEGGEQNSAHAIGITE